MGQITNFPVEILVGEDCSTDGTREICVEYAARHPGKILLFKHTRETVIRINGKATGRYNLIHNLTHAQGRYIALCEGDDYWVDPHKLQKQVDFLEQHEDFAICFHAVKILRNGALVDDDITNPPQAVTTILDLARRNYIHTPSCMFRNRNPEPIPEFFYSVPIGDYPLHMLNARHGKIGFLADKMAVYRVHSDGAWSAQPDTYRYANFVEVLNQLVDFFGSEPSVRDALSQHRYASLTHLLVLHAKNRDVEAVAGILSQLLKLEPGRFAQQFIAMFNQS